MKRFSRLILWTGLVAALGIGTAPAQGAGLFELMRSAVLDQPSDLFGCGAGNNACDLGYRVYPSVDPSEVNGPG